MDSISNENVAILKCINSLSHWLFGRIDLAYIFITIWVPNNNWVSKEGVISTDVVDVRVCIFVVVGAGFDESASFVASEVNGAFDLPFNKVA